MSPIPNPLEETMEQDRKDKLSYHTPVLTLHGEMREITANSGSAGAGDNISAAWGNSPVAS
jgi:hypothetical protein